MIGIFDSGAGGLSVLREIIKAIPEGQYIYFSDNAYCPYGEKTREEITDRARAITDLLLLEGADIIVVACNTATAAAISTLRAEYADPADPDVRERVLALTGGRHDHVRFIGMEPAVKQAIGLTRTGTVGVLATVGTLGGDKYLTTRDKYKGDCRIVEHAGVGYVALVESGETEGPHAEEVVRASLQPLLDAGADTIVLGCTHYPFLLETMKAIAPEGTRFIDPAPAVARQLKAVMDSEGINEEDGPGVRLLGSGSLETLQKLYRLIL